MHASNAFLNGAAATRTESLTLLKALRANGVESPSLDKGKSADERQAEHERKSPSANEREGGDFKNDPDDASNPNEVRERHQRKITPP